MQVVEKSDFTIPAERKLIYRRIPGGIELEEESGATNVTEEFLAGCSNLKVQPNSISVATFDKPANEIRDRIQDACGIEGVEVKICESNFDLIQHITARSRICAGASSKTDNYVRTIQPLAQALVTSGAARGVQDLFNQDLSELSLYFPSHAQLVRSQSGRSRIVDASTVKQSILSRIRSFSGDLNRLHPDAFMRQDRADPSPLATFCMFDSADTEQTLYRQLHYERLKDDDDVLGFTAIERITAEFSRFVIQNEKLHEEQNGSRLVIQVNSFCVASLIARKLKLGDRNQTGRSIICPDVFLGWAPELTLLRHLTSKDGAAILCLQRFPLVEFLFFPKARKQ